jgi:hypothetical protein
MPSEGKVEDLIMKLFLIIVQSFYSIMLLPWFFVWGLSFMVFDNGISLWGIGIVIIVSLYPVAVTVCSILSWVYRKMVKPIYIVFINLVPLLWIIAFAVIIFVV